MGIITTGAILFLVLGLSTQKALETEERVDIPTGECGVANSVGKRIVGGKETSPPNKYPWLVALKVKLSNGQYYQFCGASVITQNHLLTAAHCFYNTGFKESDIRAYLGSYNLNVNEANRVIRDISKINIHNLYNSKSHDNDITVLKMSSPVQYSNYIKPVCIPSTIYDITNKPVNVAGWGLTSENSQYPSTVLRDVDITGANINSCNIKYRYTLTSNMLCAGSPTGGKDSCQGDSGGPLTYKCGNRYMQVGVVSFGVGCAQADYQGIYSQVAKYTDFLKNNTSPDKPCFLSCTS